MFGDFLSNASSFREENPGVLSMIGAGMMNGNLGEGFMNAAKLQQVAGQRNRMVKWLTAKGMSPEDAQIYASQPELLKQALEGKERKLINAGDGRLYDPETNEWITAPGGPMGDVPTSIQEWEYGQKDPAFMEHLKSGKGRDSILTTVDKKAIFEAEDELPAVDGTLSALTRAKDLNEKTYTGYTAGARGWAGANLPVIGNLFDEDTSKNTLEFNNLMSFESIKTMADTLKGATTDFELNKFVEILADPATPPEIRGRTIDRMIKLAERKKKIAEDRINKLRGGDYYDAPGGETGDGWTDLGNGVRVRQK